MKHLIFNSATLIMLVLIASGFIFKGCSKDISEFQKQNEIIVENADEEIRVAKNVNGNIQVDFPANDPGAPFYMRSGPILKQFFVSDGWLVIPFFRDPSCIRPDFNLLQVFDVPAAFSCALTVEGFYIIEADASQGSFPMIVQSTGSAVPFWFVKWDAFSQISEDGKVTIDEIKTINPLKGTAHKFKETLRPRMDNHHVQMNASGTLEDGRLFNFHVTHVGDVTKNIGLKFN